MYLHGLRVETINNGGLWLCAAV